jgi:hypothetical protein
VRAVGTVYASLRVASSGDVWVTFQFPHEDDAAEYWRHDSNGWTHWEVSESPPPELDSARSSPAMPYGDGATFQGVRWESGRNGIYRTEPGVSGTSAREFVATTSASTTSTPATDHIATTTTSTTTTTTWVPGNTTTPTTSPPYHVGMDGSLLPQWPEDGGLFGSGCTPGGRELPDGVWFGSIDTYRDTDVAFDLACLYASGDQVRMENNSPTMRPLTVTHDTVVWALSDSGPGWIQIPYGEWTGPSSRCPIGGTPDRDGCFWWVYLNDGFVTEMLEVAFR